MLEPGRAVERGGDLYIPRWMRPAGCSRSEASRPSWTYAGINLATQDLHGTFEQLQAGDAEIVRGADQPTYGIHDGAFRDPAGNGDPHPGAALSRPAIAPEVKRPGLIWHKEVPRNG
jgi:hypothetical protein